MVSHTEMPQEGVTADAALLEELTVALKSKNCRAVQRCIAKLKSDFSIPLNTCTVNGLSLLQISVDICCPEAVQMILEKGAVANLKVGTEFLIHRAVASGDMNVVKQLIMCGAKVNSLDDDGLSPLFVAVTHNNERIVNLLLKSGAFLDGRSNERETILETAVIWNAGVKIFELLFSYGVDINARFSDNTTLLVTIVCMFLEDNVNEKRAEALLRLALENGALIAEKDGENGLHVAARYGLSTPVKVLLQHDVNINFESRFKSLPLTFALDEFFKITYLFLRKNDDNNLTLDDVEPYKETAFLLIQQVVKLQQAKKEVIAENITEARDARIEFFYDYCVKELKEMKCEKIVKDVSYFDFLIAEEYKLANYVKNSKVLQILKKEDYLLKFPLYSDELEARIEKGKSRNKLLLSSGELLKKILNFNLPDLILCEIFSYLKSTDLIVLPKVLIRHRR